jgi:cyclohexanone monooxygenase
VPESKAQREEAAELDAVVVGAGFAGLYMLHRLRGLGLSVRVFEAGDGVGGTWYWNRYPGARCDVESLEYSYQFDEDLQQEWKWSERYSPQSEILEYLNHVADRFDLRRDIQFETRVVSAHYDEATDRWHVATDRGNRLRARFCVMATGCLSSANTPDFEGLADFQGDVFHTGRWPHEGVDFSGKRVAVIGTGSSAIQSIPIIAREAEHLTVFQRTPNYTIPAHNQRLDPAVERDVKSRYREFREQAAQQGFGLYMAGRDESAFEVGDDEREAEYETRWERGGLQFMGSFNDLTADPKANDTAREFVVGKLLGVVDDPEVAERLTPTTPVGCKRLCVDTGYWATFNRDDVTLVDVSEKPIERITANAVETGGRAYEVDALVLATGFDAMTGAVLAIDVRGRGGRTLADKWSAGPRTYLGLATAGFPNLFTITGPGSPSVLSNMVPSIEQHVNWIADCLVHLRETGVCSIEAELEAEDAWVAHVNELAGESIYPSCNSWYLGANVPGKPRVFMPYLGFPPYVEKCEEVVANSYEGFVLAGRSE